MAVAMIKKAPEALVRESMGDVKLFSKLLTVAFGDSLEVADEIDFDLMKAVSAMENRESTNVYKYLVSAAHSLRLTGDL